MLALEALGLRLPRQRPDLLAQRADVGVRDADRPLRHRGAEAALPARACATARSSARTRMTEPGSGSDAFAWHDRAARTATATSSTARRRSSPTRPRPTSSSCSRTIDQGARLRRRHGVPRRARDAGAHRRRAALEDGPADVADGRGLLRRLRRAGGRTCSGRPGAGHGRLQRLDGLGAELHPREHGRARWQRQLERSIAYARERRQFGQPIGKFQAVSHTASST